MRGAKLCRRDGRDKKKVTFLLPQVRRDRERKRLVPLSVHITCGRGEATFLYILGCSPCRAQGELWLYAFFRRIASTAGIPDRNNIHVDASGTAATYTTMSL